MKKKHFDNVFYYFCINEQERQAHPSQGPVVPRSETITADVRGLVGTGKIVMKNMTIYLCVPKRIAIFAQSFRRPRSLGWDGKSKTT